MSAFVNYYITKVHYDKDRKFIASVKIHENLGKQLGPEETWTRNDVIKKIDSGSLIMTAPRDRNGKLTVGAEVIVYEVKGKRYLKTVRNDKEEDNLGNLPEF